ncbi:hypothetical protein ACKAV7_011840 [Fusarium commune]
MLDQEHEGLPDQPSNDDNSYVLGSIKQHNIVMPVLPDYGISSATSAVKSMQSTFPNLRFILMVGIGGGIPSKQHDIRLGDVAVSEPDGQVEASSSYGENQWAKARPTQDLPRCSIVGRMRETTAHYIRAPTCLAIEVGDPELDRDNMPHIETWFRGGDTIAKICVTYLTLDEFKRGHCSCHESDSEFKERLRLNHLYDYAASNWGHHAREGHGTDPEPDTPITSTTRHLATTGLHMAAYFGIKEAVDALIQHGSDISSRDWRDRTPLSWAAENGHEDVVKLLLAAGAPVESSNGYWSTRWILPLRNGHAEVVKLLLAEGAAAGPEAESKYYYEYYEETLLSLAMARGDEEIMRLLLVAGAPADAGPKNRHGLTPLSEATSGRRSPSQLGGHEEWHRGAGTNRCDNEGHDDTAKLLLAAGAYVGPDDHDHYTPLFYDWGACDEVDRVKYCWSQELILTREVSEEVPALIAAAKRDDKHIAKLLLAAGADPNSEGCDWGPTPLAEAAERSDMEMVELLLAAGADIDRKTTDLVIMAERH